MFGLTLRNNYPAYRYDPWHEMEAMERRFFGPMMDAFFSTERIPQFRTDVTDEGDAYLLETDLPGFEKKDIQLQIEGDTLTIRAERHGKNEEKENNKVVRMERSYGVYSRSYDISQINTETIKAKYENGVLQLILPKKEQILPETRRIEIE